MGEKASAHEIAALAQSEALWALFVGSGQADHTNPALLRRAKKDLKRSFKVDKGHKEVRECRRKGLERILGYLAEGR